MSAGQGAAQGAQGGGSDAEQLSADDALEQQKRACVFCRMVRGEIPAKQVYEDERFLAILDIRPAADGHVLLLPKEHIPLLPLMPQEQAQELFALAGTLSAGLREAMGAQSVTVFIASGAAAGQQAPHLLVHLIPREPGDGLDMLDLAQRTVPQADTIALSSLFAQATQQMLVHLGRKDLVAPPPAPAQLPAGQAAGMPAPRVIEPVPASFEEVDEASLPAAQSGPAPLAPLPVPAPHVAPQAAASAPAQPLQPVTAPAASGPAQEEEGYENPNEALQTVLATNADLRRLLIAEPSLVEDYVARSPNLRKLFEGVNIRALSLMLRRQEESEQQERGEQPRAGAMDEPELFAFIDGNEGLRTWLLEHPEELAAGLGQNPRLQAFFEGVDILLLAARYRAYREAER